MTLKNVTFLFIAGSALYLAATFVLDHPSATPTTLFEVIGETAADTVRAGVSFLLGGIQS